MSSHAWLDSLSEDWISQPGTLNSKPPTLNGNGASTPDFRSSGGAKGSGSKIPRPRTNSHAAERKFAATPRANSSAILNERTSSDINIPAPSNDRHPLKLSGQLRQPSFLRGHRASKSYSESPAVSLAGSVIHNTVSRRSTSSSPGKNKGNTPEWRRLINGGQLDMFTNSAATGLERMFEPPPPGKSSLGQTHVNDDEPAVDQDMKAQNPSAYAHQHANHEYHDESSSVESFSPPRQSAQPKGRSVQYRLNEDAGDDISRASDLSSPPRSPLEAGVTPGSSHLSSPSVKPPGMLDPNSRMFSNQSAAQHEVFSPILIAKQSSEDGKIDYAPVGLSASELQHRLQKLQDDPFMLSDSQGSGSRDDSRTGTRSNEETEGLKALNSFVNVRRGGQSADDSFHHHVLTPAIGNISDLLPEESLQASTPKQFPSLRVHAPGEYNSRPRTPPVPAAPFPSPNKRSLQPPGNGTSPLKLFGQYDTFTNQIFLRRISQFEGSNSTPSTEFPPGGRKVSADMLRHVLDPASRSASGSQQVMQNDAVRQQRSTRSFSQFGAGDLDGFAFNEDFTRHTDDSGDGSVVHRSVSFGTNNDTSPQAHSNIVIGKRHQASDVTTSTNVRTLSRELATKAVSLLSTPKHQDLAAEYKRHLTSPSKNPTPKRRRTLHQADIAFGADDDNDQLMEPDLSSHQVQLVNGKKRKDARPGDRQQTAHSHVLASRNLLRPRTPSINKKVTGQKDMLLHQDSPVLQEEIAKIQRALPQNAQNDNIASDGGRKPSIQTEDYLSMAQKIMAAIRGKNGVASGLASVEESDDEHNRQSEENTSDDVSFQESTRERFSRPPSREGPPIPRVTQRQEDPNLADHLKQYEEHSDMGDIIAASLRSLGVSKEDIEAVQALEARSYSSRSENSSSGNPEEGSQIVSDPPNIRISEPNRYENSTAAEQAERYRDRFPSHGSGSDSAFSTIRTGSSRNSDTRRTIAPESVSHLIPDQVGSMRLDKKLNIWVKDSKPRPTRSKRERSNTLVSDHSEEDPFAGIPDLPVDQSREMQNLRLRNAQHLAESMRASSHAGPGMNGSAPKHGGPLKPILVKDSADRQGKWEPARSPSRLMEQFVEADDEDVEHEITLHDDRLGENSAKRRAQVNFSSPVSIVIQDFATDGFSEEGDASPREPIVLHLPKPSESHRRRNVSFQSGNGHSLPKVRGNHSAPPRRAPVKGSEFIPRPVSVIEEQDEESQDSKTNGSRVVSLVDDKSLAVPSPSKSRSRQTSLNIVVSTPAARRTPQPRPENAEVISQYVGNLSLSPLSDFTAHRTPSYALELSYVLGDQNLVTGDGSRPHMSQAVRQLVDKIAEVEAFEPFWEDMQELELRDKNLESLHMLDRFCGRLVKLDVSRNGIRALEGIPPTVRELKVPCNLLSDLTAWDRLTNLQFVDISNNKIKSLSSFRSLFHLRELIADNTGLVKLDGINYHESLLSLRARGNAIEQVDFEGTNLRRMTTLDLEGNKIQRIENLDELPALSTLNLKGNCLAEFGPPGYVPLKHLDVSGNRLKVLDLTSMSRLEQVLADRNRLATVEGLGQTPKLDSLSLREQGGSRPFDVDMLARAYEVRKLFLSGNRLGTFALSRHFLNLQQLDLANCGLQKLPDELGGMMPNLRVLNLNFNGLLTISGLQGIPRLKRLYIAGNRFTDSKSLLKCLSGFSCLTEVDLRDTAVTQGFYPSIHLALQQNGGAAQSRLDPFKLPDADLSRDAKFCALLDMDTRIQRRIYERKFVRACQTLQILDGLPVNKRVRYIKDIVWKAMVERGLLLRPDGTPFDLSGVTLEENPSFVTDATGDEEFQARGRNEMGGLNESTRWGAEDSFA